MRLPINRLLNSVTSRFGVALVDQSPLDFRGITDDPIVASYLANGRAFVINVRLEDTRSAGGFRYDGANLHPFVETANAIIQGRASGYVGSPLQEYYESFQPSNAASALALSGELSESLRTAPPYGIKMPWEPGDWQKKVLRAARSAQADNISRGQNLTIQHGASGVGPISVEKGELEFRTIFRLVESVRERGLLRHPGVDGDIGGIPLINDRNLVKIMVRQGKHRMAAAAALDINEVPIRLNFKNAVREVELSAWPQVQNGIYSDQQALEVFKSVFEGIPHSSRVGRMGCGAPRTAACVGANSIETGK
jgi:hypothetical protein